MTSSRSLGRRVAPDRRDLDYLAAPVLPASSTRRYRYWQTALADRLDQGQTDTCVGHGWSHYLVTSPLTPTYDQLLSRVPASWPVRTGPPVTPFPARVYDQAQLVDEFSDTPPAGGTSVRAGAKALSAIGEISDYRWLTSTDQISLTLLELGPVCVGSSWYNSMFDPTPVGAGGSLVTVDEASGLAGGHCYLLNGVNLDHGRYRFLNSWGTGWGNNGMAYMLISDFAKLLADQGEACLTSDLI